jgi:hypothetical protein
MVPRRVEAIGCMVGCMTIAAVALSLSAAARDRTLAPTACVVRVTPGEHSGGPAAQSGGSPRLSAPQPVQKQGIEYFVGAWTFTWTGRESPITPGPRGGTLTMVHGAALNQLEMRIEGRVEDGPPFEETGTIEWDDAKKAITVTERLSNGSQIQGTGDWSSPLGITYESRPVKAGNQTVRVRRAYSILSATSFTIVEEISIDGRPFVRLGTGAFSKAVLR